MIQLIHNFFKVILGSQLNTPIFTTIWYDGLIGYLSFSYRFIMFFSLLTISNIDSFINEHEISCGSKIFLFIF